MATSLDISIEATRQAPTVARNVVEAAYIDSLAAVTLQDLKVIVTELVTNSWKYGPGDSIRLMLEPSEHSIHGWVEDGGRVAFTKCEIRDDGGLGLHIVDALAGDWEVSQAGGSVRFSLMSELH